ncbi:MAG: DMT family transporter, partial [Firmicutes bacterium]|nr:DMT family transporter [Bacillota bacterium]
AGRYILAGAVCGLFLCLGTDLQQIGILLTTVGKSGFLTSLYTVLVPVFGALIFRKKMPAAIWLGALLALAGVYFLSGAEGLDLAPEDLALIGCALAFAFQILFVDHFVKDLDPVKLSATQFLFCAFYSLAAAFIWEKPTFAMMTSAVIPTLYAGVVSGGVGYTLQIIGQKLSDPAPAAILMSLEAVFSAVFGAILLGQVMSGREVLGSCIMLAAVVLVQLSSLEKQN